MLFTDSSLPFTSSLRFAAVAAALGLSQNEIQRRTGLSYRTINAAWHGKPCSLSTWVTIAKKMPVALHDIAPLAAAELDGLVIR
jgi:hypothetical protein